VSRNQVAVCVDFGSTFTKASLVDLRAGGILARAEHPTTIETDLLDGYDACLAELVAADARAAEAEVLACSSAGGGLRIAVVGNEELVTAEAGRRVALSSGGKVVAVIAVADGVVLDRLAEPDVVLLTGGTDDGNTEAITTAARELVAAGWTGPVVVAGNVDAQGAVSEILGEVPHVLADNVVPAIGVLAPDSARAAIREMFLAHVIGGKHLSARADFTEMVRGATPDVVLTGVEVLAGAAGDVVVVDVGGATTDVHSVVKLDPALRDGSSLASSGTGPELSREVVATTPVTRTVEGDLGMRSSAVATAAAALRDASSLGSSGTTRLDDLREAAARRTAEPGFVPSTEQELEEDERLASAAAGLALRRHAGRARVVVSPEGRVIERSGKDLREVRLLVGSGGVLRHGRAGVAERVLGPSTGAHLEGGWQLPENPAIVVDADYVLAAVGLLADEAPDAAYRLALTLLDPGV
jgi:uncharacterized protein (TIGR01319 family)